MPSYPSVASKSEIAFYHGKVGDDNTLMMRKHHLSLPHFGGPPRGPDLVKDYHLLVYHHKSYHSALLILLRTRHIS